MNQPDVVPTDNAADGVFEWGTQMASFGGRVASAKSGTLRLHVPEGQELCCAGIDLVDVRRVGHLVDQYGLMFVKRIATAFEIEALPDDPDARIGYLAGLLGVKESVIKALHGIPEGGRFTDIVVNELRKGSSAVGLNGAVAVRADRKGIRAMAGGIADDADPGPGRRLAWAVGLRGSSLSVERHDAEDAPAAVKDGMGAIA